MALEAAIYSQDPFGYAPFFKDYYGYGFQQQQQQKEEEEHGAVNKSVLHDKTMFNDSTQQPVHGMSNCWDCYCCYNNQHHHSSSSPELCTTAAVSAFSNPEEAAVGSTSIAPRRKRRRIKNAKNKEEMENQRMTHIAVERNRRKQMNEYLALMRSLMPSSYVQRGDQASIVGGAINFVKELEQLLQAMEAQKAAKQQQVEHEDDGQAELASNGGSSSQLFSEFFAFPQYSTLNQTLQAQSPIASVESGDKMTDSLGGEAMEAAVGEIEVTMVESYANVKILARKQPRQLLKLVAGLQSLMLTILHLNVTTTSDQMVLYSLSFKVEEGCHLNTVDEIAAVVNQMLRRIEEGSC